LIILALYPHDTISFVCGHAARLAGRTVIDCCGVKRIVLDAVMPISLEHGFVFIGGHPMAGREYSGFEYSKVELFDGASMVLTPGPTAEIELLDRMKHFFLSIGFERIRISNPAEHDQIIAYTSQLAHVLSSAYVKSDAAMLHYGFSAGSFQDMTRVALLNEDMWTELFLANRDNLSSEVEALATRLSQYAAAIRGGDEPLLRLLLREGRERKKYLTEREANE
jgi:prephenate dehydrogenase